VGRAILAPKVEVHYSFLQSVARQIEKPPSTRSDVDPDDKYIPL
jgi:hypothetical protein